ncbi:hypothetical protein [Microbulbifer discodermiae]|uniref:hypothetical protein n=1 Tax=Microbulbifer sp. 2201CG32-9 TaxID=3232309 RepID=UPI00345B8537
MKINIPLNVDSDTNGCEAAHRGARLRLPLGLSRSKLGLVEPSRLQSRTLRAIAAAVSVLNPAKALEISQQAEESPEDVVGATLEGAALEKLKQLSSAIATAETELADLPVPGEVVRVAARAVDADARLVGVAMARIRGEGKDKLDSQMYSAALNWVAAIDFQLLRKAPREGVRERLINLVPEAPDSDAELESRVEQLETALQKLREECARSEKAKAK